VVLLMLLSKNFVRLLALPNQSSDVQLTLLSQNFVESLAQLSRCSMMR
jgi:hypothetical protein